MNKQNVLFVILLIIATTGYFIAYLQYRDKLDLENQLMDTQMNAINQLNDSLLVIQSNKDITLEELMKSKRKLEALIKSAAVTDTTHLTIGEALNIINGVK